MGTDNEVISILDRLAEAVAADFNPAGEPGTLIDMADERDKRAPKKDKLRELVDKAIDDRLAEAFIAEMDRLREQIADRDVWINALNEDATGSRDREKALLAHIKELQAHAKELQASAWAHIKELQAQIRELQGTDLARLENSREASERYRATLRRMLRGCDDGWDVARLAAAIEAVLGDPEPSKADNGDQD